MRIVHGMIVHFNGLNWWVTCQIHACHVAQPGYDILVQVRFLLFIFISIGRPIMHCYLIGRSLGCILLSNQCTMYIPHNALTMHNFLSSCVSCTKQFSCRCLHTRLHGQIGFEIINGGGDIGHGSICTYSGPPSQHTHTHTHNCIISLISINIIE